MARWMPWVTSGVVGCLAEARTCPSDMLSRTASLMRFSNESRHSVYDKRVGSPDVDTETEDGFLIIHHGGAVVTPCLINAIGPSMLHL